MTIACLNGHFLPLAEAQISPMDRGFLFGDGVYEVIPVYNGFPLRLAQHLTRLANSLAAIKLTVALDNNAWEQLVLTLIQRNGGGDQSVYLQCTRGAAPVRDHVFPAHVNPTVFAYSTPLPARSIADISKGMRAITTQDTRWQRCDIKAITLLPNILMRQHAIENNAQEAILINNGYALEGTSMNLFVIKNNIIMTPPLSPRILGGITRDLVLELARQNNYAYREIDIPAADLLTADEIWLTSSTREIVPVLQLNNCPVNNGLPGALWHKMIVSYQHFKANFNA